MKSLKNQIRPSVLINKTDQIHNRIHFNIYAIFDVINVDIKDPIYKNSQNKYKNFSKATLKSLQNETT